MRLYVHCETQAGGRGEKKSVERSYRLTNREMNCIVGEEVITWN